MPWKECEPMDEKLKFIARLLDGEKMAPLCREFGISRKTGYKIFERYKDSGIEGLNDRSRRPYRHANRLPFQIERMIVTLKQDYPHWGAPKIREKLAHRYPQVHCPAISTVHAVLDRHGLVNRKKRRRYKPQGTPLQDTQKPNGLWCADYKGEFMMGNRHYCYPLTITDYHSRFLLACDGNENTKEAHAFRVFEQAFKEYGVPNTIARITDCRSPRPMPCSACPNSLSGGCAWVSVLNASSQGIRNKTVGMSVCI